MPDDALAKAAYEATHHIDPSLAPFLVVWTWAKDENGKWYPQAGVETWDSLPENVKEQWRNVARAVLEAAGYDDLLEILRFAKQKLPRICVACFRGDCEDCPLREVVKKAKAALQRAGEE